MRKVKIKQVNDMVVWDVYSLMMILKKPKRRYRAIVRAFCKRKAKEVKGVKK